jgi:hypothetical protein
MFITLRFRPETVRVHSTVEIVVTYGAVDEARVRDSRSCIRHFVDIQRLRRRGRVGQVDRSSIYNTPLAVGKRATRDKRRATRHARTSRTRIQPVTPFLPHRTTSDLRPPRSRLWSRDDTTHTAHLLRTSDLAQEERESASSRDNIGHPALRRPTRHMAR